MPDASLPPPPSSQRSVIVGTTPLTLLRIDEAAVSLAVWNRSMHPQVAHWLDRLPADRLPTARFTCRGGEARRQVMAAFAGRGDAGEAAWRILQEDIIGQIERFVRLRPVPSIEVRLEVISDDACAKFHADHLSLRLMTTYRGPATEWLDPALAAEACCPADVPPAAIRRLSRFAVAVIKGRKARCRSGPLVLHRSPSIEGRGQTRFFLCVNEALTP